MPNTNPAAAPVDYPPAVLEEAERASLAAFEAGRRDFPGSFTAPRHAAAEAYAAVLARHTVAVRMAAEPDGAYLAAAMTAAIGDGRGAHEADCGCCACLAPLIDAAAEDRAWAMLTSRLLAVSAERDALAKRVEALRDAAKFVAVPIPCTTSILRNCAAKALAADDKAAQS